MKIVLINIPCPNILDNRLEAPLGLLYIQSYLNHEGYDCIVHDCAIHGQDVKDIPIADAYGFSTYTNNYNKCLELSHKLRIRHPNSIHIAGGYHVSSIPEECIREWDHLVIGEGESAVLDCLGLKHSDIKRLDDLPFPIYNKEVLDRYSRTNDGQKVVSILCSRGCPNRCNFCNSSVFKLSKYRSRTVDNILREVDSLAEMGIHSIKINDDNFLDVVDSPDILCKSLGERNVKYRIMTSAPSMTTDNAIMLKETGCYYVSIGIESMSDKMLKAMNKPSSVDENINSINNAKRAGLRLRIFVLVGFPGETDETVSETTKILKSLDYDDIGIYPFVPYPGTDVWNNPRKYNASIDKDFCNYISADIGGQGAFVLETDQFSVEDVRRWHTGMKSELLINHRWSKS